MSYLLIGNISAMIGEDCIEPLSNARIRVYLPESNPGADHMTIVKGIFNHLRPLSAKEVLMKADRLLAETTLDPKGNFRLYWNELHLFTEPLELDICLDEMPAKNGNRQSRNFHLSYMIPHWKRNQEGYLAAYAYVIPAEVWSNIYRQAGAWVLTGIVRNKANGEGESRLKVSAFNAITGKKIADAYTNEYGRYTMHFNRRDLFAGQLIPIRDGRPNFGPDVYFRLYKQDQLIWEENESHAMVTARQDIAPCSSIDILYKPGIIVRATRHITGWLNSVRHFTEVRRGRSRASSAVLHRQLIVKDTPNV
ncbi:hypothetical protein CLV59_106276 [Chitinophaga dinghuensis]|uniref:Carboxypeptidase regulatory-like domain-containing protein n=1 Tax=Chitinophaga dinghuensis TaxID=1539050 RepID=A0A327VW76_9BACT|nr:hypothetical protein [Chitinophaga dinghuensis]RAJ79215.1 hypothetical protein CLV59_106276 [Chitinophaga dinghuensis]